MPTSEIWKTYNDDFEVSDQGKVRLIGEGPPVEQFSTGVGYLFIKYNKKPSWCGILYVHRMVLSAFRPKHARCMTFCDHINRKRDDNRLVNLRWSNVVLNGMNRNNCKGYFQVKTMYAPCCKVLDRRYRFGNYETPEEARKVYLNFQFRAFEVIEALMKRDIPVEIQRLIMDFWLQRLRGRAKTPQRESWKLSNASLWGPQKKICRRPSERGESCVIHVN
jgi:hypothetical protein